MRRTVTVWLLLMALGFAMPAEAFSPSPEFRHYRSIFVRYKVRKDIPLFNIRHGGPSYVGTHFELRGMVDGTMVYNGRRSICLKVGTLALEVQLSGPGFNCSRGTPVWVVLKVKESGAKVPPDMELVAFVRAEEMAAWQREEERRLARSSRAPRIVWSTPWPKEMQEQAAVGARWIQTFNPSLSDGEAERYAKIILHYARHYGIDPRLAMAMVAAESAYNVRAVSRSGAQGLGQLMPGTAAMLGVSNPFDPEQNLEGSIRYLRDLKAKWNDTKTPLALTMASYNAGPGAVAQYGGIPPYQETQSYVSYVLSLFRELGGKGM